MSNNYDICVECYLKVNDGSAGAYVAVNGVTSITMPSGTIAKVKASYMGQADRILKHKPGMETPDDITATCNHDNEEFDRLFDLKGTEKNFKIGFLDTSPALVATFAGYIADVRADLQLEELGMFEITIVRTGAITLGTT